MRSIFLRVAVIGMICSWALPDSQSGVRKRETAHRYCGSNLANILRFVCNGSYNTNDYWKRNTGSIQVKQAQDVDDSLWVQPEDSDQFPFRPWWVANQLTNRVFRRQRRDVGIVEECCIFKGCTRTELSEYCAARVVSEPVAI